MSTVRGQVNLRLDELLQLKHLNGSLLSLLAFWALASLDMQAGGLLFLAAALSVVALVRPLWLGRLPPVVWNYAGPVVLFIVLADFVLSLPGLIPPLVRMIIWLLLYRNLAPRRQREDMQLILLCLFSVVLSGALTVSLLFALQILLFTPLAMAQLLLICILDRGEETQKASADWSGFKWWPLLRRLREVLDWRVLSLGSLLFGFVVVVSTLLFILTPRVNLNHNLPFLQMRTEAMMGFSENVTLGAVSELLENRAVAVRVDVPSLEAIDPDPYWRMLVLDEYTGGGFRVSESLKRQAQRSLVRELRGGLRRRPGGEDLWTFYMEGGVSRYLPVPGEYRTMRFQTVRDFEFYEPVAVHAIDAVTQSVFSFQIDGLQFDRRIAISTEDALKLNELSAGSGTEAADPTYPETTLQLSMSAENRAVLAGINEAIRSEGNLTVPAYSQAATEYLWNRFNYSLRPDGQIGTGAGTTGDPVVYWLLNGSQGHCELFASAFILLAREAGIPARMIVGFAGGSWNSVENYFVLRQSEAHAWVEVFDAEAKAWLRVDPTPGSGSSDPNAAVALGGRVRAFDRGWGAWVDSLRIQWYRRIVNFEQEDQIALATSLKNLAVSLTGGLRDQLRQMGQSFREWFKAVLQGRELLPVFLVLFLGSTVYLLWRCRHLLARWLFRSDVLARRMRAERRLAGRYLKRFQNRQSAVEERALQNELRAIRYGPEQPMPKVQAVFASAKRILRKRGYASVVPDRLRHRSQR